MIMNQAGTMNRREMLKVISAAGVPLAAQQPQRRPNFVILFADDMGYGDLGCYGHPTIRTPNLDRMAEEGARFTSLYAAAPVCTPSRVGLLTGRYPMRAGQPGNTGPETMGGLPLREILLPQVLKQQGYRTMAIGKWHLGYQPKEQLPTSRGFDEWVGLPYSNDMIPPWVKTDVPLYLYRGTERVERVTEQSNLTMLYTEEARRFIQASGNDPFFLYLPYSMPHLPVSAPGARLGRSRAGLYGDVIETLDWSVGQILETLRAQGVENETMVVFASDNGPWHDLPPRMLAGGVEPWHTGTKSLLRGAKATTYEGGVRVPGLMRWPGVIPPKQVLREMVSTLDLFPTLTRAAGASMPADRVYDGFDLMPHLREGAASPRKEFFYFDEKKLEAVRQGPWKYRISKKKRETNAQPELYHLDWDPAEQYNVYGRQGEIAGRLAARLKAFAEELGAD